MSSADQSKLDASIQQGFRWALDTYRSDTEGRLQANRPVMVQSSFVNTRIKMKLKGYAFEQDPGRVGFVLAAPSWPTVYSMPADMAVVTSG
ncbi:hypothetical protein [Oleiagrimonas soli]|uniref:Uncharacterized protein n=1 Tax=Oleiagrimonas soli TaxID=1543381 RepID=A0A099D0P4_9GAMM|nr:hypothetical protein [Oleiagrimonas soli]KGI78860.1 hypothetical protein LF63_0102720 [Oleiagrimonas soli]MBB6184341.1 hypothetical protein [Oleiagrimonas soli]